MNASPIGYVEPLYRPPSEADSLDSAGDQRLFLESVHILRNVHRPQKRFRPRDEEEMLESVRRSGEQFGAGVKRVFLADGDAMTLSTRRLANVLEAIRRELPGVRRVSSHCSVAAPPLQRDPGQTRLPRIPPRAPVGLGSSPDAKLFR